MYRVLWDGDPTQLRSDEAHLEPEREEDAGGEDGGQEGENDGEAEAGDQGVVRVDQHPNEEAAPGPAEQTAGPAVPMGGPVVVGGRTWVRVADMGVDVRVEENEVVTPPKFHIKNDAIDDDTTELDIFELLLPMPVSDLSDIVKFRAAEAGDKYGDHWYPEHVLAYFLCLFGGSLYKKGTDLWSREPLGVMPAPDFGRFLTHDRFLRVQRYLGRGPEGCDENLDGDPWAQFRPFIDGYNEVRARELSAGATITPDETMFAWTGKSGVGGLPHMSWVQRKPEPLGLELKTICDAETGVMLYVEMQEGAVRMARKKYCNDMKATTACTARLVEGADPGDGKKRTVYADSWFTGVETFERISELFDCHLVGPVKTNHAEFPAEAMRWTLVGSERGDKVVFKCEGEDLWAVGWNDIHFKLYLASCGTVLPGPPAQKMRQRADGRNTSIDVPRPSVVAEYALNMGRVDQHNRYRQGTMALHKTWKTNTWQHRMLNELFALTAVDAFLISARYMPKWKDDEGEENSKFFRWLHALMSCMIYRIGENDNVQRAEVFHSNASVCKQVLIGKKRQIGGTNHGRMCSRQERCRYCAREKRYPPVNPGTKVKRGAFRTSWTCSVHGDVFMCRRGRHTCWAEHLAEVAEEGR